MCISSLQVVVSISSIVFGRRNGGLVACVAFTAPFGMAIRVVAFAAAAAGEFFSVCLYFFCFSLLPLLLPAEAGR